MTDELAVILAECLDALDQGDSLEACLMRYPQHRQELARLLAAAVELRAAPAAEPSARFRRTARARLLRRLRSAELVTSGGWLRSLWQTLLLAQRRPAMRWVLIGALALSLFAGGGAVYASNDALPGEALYPVKLVVEETRLAMSFTVVGDTQLQVEFAGRRLAEAQELLGAGQAQAAGQVLGHYASEMATVAGTLRGLGGADVPAGVRAALDAQADTLAQLRAVAPSDAQQALDSALSASRETHDLLDVLETPEHPEETHTPESTERSEMSETPEPTEAVELSETPEPTHTGEPGRTAEPTRQTTRTAAPSRTPEPTRRVEASKTPELSETSRPEDTPELTETPKPEDTPGDDDTPEPGETPKPEDTPGADDTPQPNETPKP